MTYLQTVFVLYSSEVRPSFLIKTVAPEAREMKAAFLPPLGSEDNAKFRIYFVLKISVVFSPQDDIFFLLYSCFTFDKLQKCKRSIWFPFLSSDYTLTEV